MLFKTLTGTICAMPALSQGDEFFESHLLIARSLFLHVCKGEVKQAGNVAQSVGKVLSENA